MTKPREVPFRGRVYDDPATGRKVTRVFPEGQTGVHAYFTSPSHDAQGRLILSAEFDGHMQLCRVDLARASVTVLTGFAAMRGQVFCVCAALNLAMVIDGDTLKQVDLETGASRAIFTAPAGWRIALPTVDLAGKRVAFAATETIPGLTATARIYSSMAENFYFRPRSMIFTVDLADGALAAVWGETEWISHVLINPVDPDTIVFCHEGGSLVQNRLWVVDARRLRKKTARPLFVERLEDGLVHEFFVSNGVLGVQRTLFPSEDASSGKSDRAVSTILFLNMAGQTVAEYELPGPRSGHVQSNADCSLMVSDSFYPDRDASKYEDGHKHLALHRPQGNRVTVEKLCFAGSSWTTQLSHPHPVFSPDGRQVVFSSDHGGANSAFVVEV